MSERHDATKVVIHQVVLRGSAQDDCLQKIATVYSRGDEYRVYAPPEAVGDALEWLGHLSVRVADGLGSETAAPSGVHILATDAVAEELKGIARAREAVHEQASAPAAEDEDRRFARLAIEEARKSVSENDGRAHPKVGAVVVKDGLILATAHRGEAKGNHAEFIVLEKRLADAAVAGATVYTTLEPCTTRNHPKIPCVERIIERKVKRVVIGMLDPDPRIMGRGQRRLRSANIVTDFFAHELMTEVEELNREFTRTFETARAVVVATVKQPDDVVDKWVSLEYVQRAGIAKALSEQGFELHW